MKVVLTRDVPNVGRKYEVKNVKDGYALNFLIRRGFAELGTEAKLLSAKKQEAQANELRKVKEDLIHKNLKSADGAVVTVSGKANEQGHLFAGIGKEEIVAAVKDQTHIDILPEFIVLPHPFKAVGEFNVVVKVKDIQTNLKVIVRAL